MSNKNIDCLLIFFTYDLQNLVKNMLKIFVFLGILSFQISCESTSTIKKKPEIVPETDVKIIYEPEKNISSKSTKEGNKNEDKELFNKKKDFIGIETYLQKPLNLIISNYGDFDFSKKDKIFELHRYNVGKCRIFIQNNTLNKKVISITIFHIESKYTLASYEKNLCY